jgi:tetratricopeptide (TPR) repeat protein
VPSTIEGPVLISAGTLTGFEYGSNVVNPLRGFQQLEAVTSIQDGVLVFEGTFQVPLASALSYVQEAKSLRAKKDFAGALAQARQAVAIAPDGLLAQVELGDALAAVGQKDEARAAYRRAMETVKTMEPGAREEWAAKMEKKLAAL